MGRKRRVRRSEGENGSGNEKFEIENEEEDQYEVDERRNLELLTKAAT